MNRALGRPAVEQMQGEVLQQIVIRGATFRHEVDDESVRETLNLEQLDAMCTDFIE
jgi:hypothetical protein